MQLFFTHTVAVEVRKLLVPKSALLLWYIPEKKFTKFASMCQNVFEFEIMWGGGGGREGAKGGKKQKLQKKFNKEEANFVPKMNALCHFANLIIFQVFLILLCYVFHC